jgi:hypothetical protein
MPPQTLSTVKVLENRQRRFKVQVHSSAFLSPRHAAFLRMGMRETPVDTEGTWKAEHSQEKAVHTWWLGGVMSPPQ